MILKEKKLWLNASFFLTFSLKTGRGRGLPLKKIILRVFPEVEMTISGGGRGCIKLFIQ